MLMHFFRLSVLDFFAVRFRLPDFFLISLLAGCALGRPRSFIGLLSAQPCFMRLRTRIGLACGRMFAIADVLLSGFALPAVRGRCSSFLFLLFSQRLVVVVRYDLTPAGMRGDFHLAYLLDGSTIALPGVFQTGGHKKPVITGALIVYVLIVDHLTFFTGLRQNGVGVLDRPDRSGWIALIERRFARCTVGLRRHGQWQQPRQGGTDGQQTGRFSRKRLHVNLLIQASRATIRRRPASIYSRDCISMIRETVR